MAASSNSLVDSDPDAVRRIAFPNSGDHLPDDMTDRDAVYRFLRNRGSSRVDADIAGQVADAIVTSDDVIDILEARDDVPESRDEIREWAETADEFDMGGRASTVADAVDEEVATVDDIRESVFDNEPQTREQVEQAIQQAGRVVGSSTQQIANEIVTVEDVTAQIDPGATSEPVYREDVQQAVESMDSESRFGGDPDRVGRVAEQASREIGAPSQAQVNAATSRAATGEQVTPRDVVGDSITEIDGVGDSTADTPMPVIRDQSGDTVAVAGQSAAAEAVAQEMGIESVAIGEVREDMRLEQSAGEARLTFRGRTIDEIEVE